MSAAFALAFLFATTLGSLPLALRRHAVYACSRSR
jgi:hypothetical protein